MSAVERVQAAIDKLEALKDASTPGPWERGDYPLKSNSIFGNARGFQTTFVADTIQGTGMNAELIVTLHRTIDAQLALLLQGVAFASLPDPLVSKSALALADAILGDAS